MTAKNSLSEIQKAEAKAEKIIQQAQDTVQEDKTKAKTAGEAALKDIADQCSDEINKLEKETKEQIQEKTIKEKNKINKELDSTNKVPASNKTKAVDYIISHFTKL